MLLGYDSHANLKNSLHHIKNDVCRFLKSESSSRLNFKGKNGWEESGIANSVSQRLFGLLLRVAFVFEPLAPRAISYYLTQRLKEWKKQGLISKFETRTRRLGKFHYKIEIDLDLTSKQALHVLDDLLPNKLKSVRRWFNV